MGLVATIAALKIENKNLLEKIRELESQLAQKDKLLAKKPMPCQRPHKTIRTSDETWKRYENKCLREGRLPNYN